MMLNRISVRWMESGTLALKKFSPPSARVRCHLITGETIAATQIAIE